MLFLCLNCVVVSCVVVCVCGVMCIVLAVLWFVCVLGLVLFANA